MKAVLTLLVLTLISFHASADECFTKVGIGLCSVAVKEGALPKVFTSTPGTMDCLQKAAELRDSLVQAGHCTYPQQVPQCTISKFAFTTNVFMNNDLVDIQVSQRSAERTRNWLVYFGFCTL